MQDGDKILTRHARCKQCAQCSVVKELALSQDATGSRGQVQSVQRRGPKEESKPTAATNRHDFDKSEICWRWYCCDDGKSKRGYCFQFGVGGQVNMVVGQLVAHIGANGLSPETDRWGESTRREQKIKGGPEPSKLVYYSPLGANAKYLSKLNRIVQKLSLNFTTWNLFKLSFLLFHLTQCWEKHVSQHVTEMRFNPCLQILVSNTRYRDSLLETANKASTIRCQRMPNWAQQMGLQMKSLSVCIRCSVEEQLSWFVIMP